MRFFTGLVLAIVSGVTLLSKYNKEATGVLIEGYGGPQFLILRHIDLLLKIRKVKDANDTVNLRNLDTVSEI